MDEDEDSTDTDEYEDRRRILDIPVPSGRGRCPRQTWANFQKNKTKTYWFCRKYFCGRYLVKIFLNIKSLFGRGATSMSAGSGLHLSRLYKQGSLLSCVCFSKENMLGRGGNTVVWWAIFFQKALQLKVIIVHLNFLKTRMVLPIFLSVPFFN